MISIYLLLDSYYLSYLSENQHYLKISVVSLSLSNNS